MEEEVLAAVEAFLQGAIVEDTVGVVAEDMHHTELHRLDQRASRGEMYDRRERVRKTG